MNELQHHGIKGQKWGVRRYQNKDGTLTTAGKKRFERDQRENAAKKKENRIDVSTPDPSRWAKEDLDRSKRFVDASSDLVKKAQKIEQDSSPQPKRKKLDLSKMSDKEMRDRINRELLERQYNQLFAEIEADKASKGRDTVRSVLEVAGTTLGVASSALGIALAIKELKEAVIRGEIPVCKEVSMEMNRIDDLIANPGIYYDDKAVEGWIKYCEGELTLTDGSDLNLLDSFKLWGEQVFGWYYFIDRTVYQPNKNGRGGHYVKKTIKKRLINKQYLIVGRGAAKSLYDSCIQSYFQNIDVSTTDQIVTAPTMRQSEEVLTPLKTAITRARGPLFKFLTEGSLQNTTGSKANRVKLASTKKGIENFITGSIIRVLPMSIDKLQSLRCRVATVDEWLSGDIREDPIGAIEQGASKNDDWLIIATSSEGTVRNGAGDTIKMELMDILKGDYINPHVSIWWYKLDSVDEVAYPEMWIKANPNIGKTVTYETYQLDKERAEKAPSTRNDILAKRFGLPMEGFTYYFTYEETLPHRHRDYWDMPCALGADLSQGDDFCSFTFMFPLRNGSFGIKTRNYITSRTLNKLPAATRSKYEDFMNEGSLVVLDGTVLDMMQVYEDLDEHIQQCRYDVRCFGYDPYNAKEFVERWAAENGPFGIEKVIQGSKTESVPLGELKKMAEDQMLLFDEEIMTYSMGHCVTMEDTNGNRKLFKKRYEDKIDAVAAMMDAYIAWKANRDAFE